MSVLGATADGARRADITITLSLALDASTLCGWARPRSVDTYYDNALSRARRNGILIMLTTVRDGLAFRMNRLSRNACLGERGSCYDDYDDNADDKNACADKRA